MAQIPRMKKALIETLFSLSLMFVMPLFLQSSAHQGGDDDDQVGCHGNFFSCYKDCCQKGDMFCHHREQRCLNCDTWRDMCGNDSQIPVECLRYCDKADNPPFDSNDCSCHTISIIAAAGTAVLFAVLMMALVTWARRRPVEKCPGFLRALLRLNTLRCSVCDAQSKKDPGTDTEPMLPENSGPAKTDVSAGRPPTSDGSSPSLNSQSSANSDNAGPADLQDLNITMADGDDDENNDDPGQGREPPRDGNPPPPPPPSQATTSSADSQGRRQGEMTGGSSGARGTLPSQGHGARRTRNHERPPQPQTPSPHDPDDTRKAGDYGLWMNGQRPSPTPGRRGSDIEVGREGFPLQDRLPSGNNEIISKPDFSTMNPTTEMDDGEDRHLLATGTDNPAKSYVQCQPRQ